MKRLASLVFFMFFGLMKIAARDDFVPSYPIGPSVVSPQVARMARYDSPTIALGTGAPHVNIPLVGFSDVDFNIGISLTYNHLDLVDRISRGESILAEYSYLADGTKLSALDAQGNGLLYLGSMIYRKEAGLTSLESMSWDGGRIEVQSGGVLVPMLYSTDHLGSVRVIRNGATGEIASVGNYDSYGAFEPLLGTPGRFLYNGKESQSGIASPVPYLDYGARMFDPSIGRWFTPDPLGEKYYRIGQYVYCGGNPLRYSDNQGLDWKDKALGFFMGMVTDVVPGTESWRDRVTPTSREDYNQGLKVADGLSVIVGGGMVAAGNAGVGAGTAVVVTGASAAATVVAFPEGAITAVAGVAIITGSELLTTEGAYLSLNTAKNASGGYERGNKGDIKSEAERDPEPPQGYRKIKQRTRNDKPIYTNGKNYISPDRDKHNGGVWKKARKADDLNRKTTRDGTYDENLKRIHD